MKLHQRRVRKGVCTYVAIAIHNAAMIFSPYQTSEARSAHRGSGRRVRKGVCTYVAIAIQNAAMQAISPSNVSSIMQICLFRCRGDHCKRLFLMSLSSRTKAFSRGEGGALPAMMLSSIESVRNSCGFVARKRRRQCDGRGQANLSSC